MTTDLKDRTRETWEFRAIYAVCFLVCLIGACLSRLLPKRLRSAQDHPLGSKSIYGEAKLAANNSVPFAFM